MVETGVLSTQFCSISTVCCPQSYSVETPCTGLCSQHTGSIRGESDLPSQVFCPRAESGYRIVSNCTHVSSYQLRFCEWGWLTQTPFTEWGKNKQTFTPFETLNTAASIKDVCSSCPRLVPLASILVGPTTSHPLITVLSATLAPPWGQQRDYSPLLHSCPGHDPNCLKCVCVELMDYVVM